ncbi:pyridoxamine 5'-phosphate oxidase family protein [Inquilinus limosus]|uniref:pyridoxamine 5'-phosphate oxidase family protein n=1 Tax=Inquilinus limosus TaxID=171674 RepID=UPI003F182DE7
MAKQFPGITPAQQDFIRRQRIFFTASAAATGRVNVSPRGTDMLRVLGPNAILYLDLTGSGNETAAHLRATGRLTIMFCAFEGAPMILRLYGAGRVLRRGGPDYARLLAAEYGGAEPLGARQMVWLDIDLVQTSCGFGVPLFDYAGERPTLARWAEAKEAQEGLEAYRRQKNTHSIEGLPTGLFEEDPVPAG